jgi:transposase
MYKIVPEYRLEVASYYLNNGTTLKETAKRFNVHYQSVFKWVKLYREKGSERLLSSYRRPWNRTRKEVEERIVQLKEKHPGLTVRNAKVKLGKEGIEISIKAIWNIWKRYGYSGFAKRRLSNDFTDFIVWTKESEYKFGRARSVFETGNIKMAAKLLNAIPALPKNELILQIPDRLLNFRRRVEKIPCIFGEIPLNSYMRIIDRLYRNLRKEGLHYSALRVGLTECIAREWTLEPEKSLQRLEELEKIIKASNRNFSRSLFAPYSTALLAKAVAYAQLYKVGEAKQNVSRYDRLLKTRPIRSPYLMLDLATLYSVMENYRKAEYWFLRALDKIGKSFKGAIMGEIAYISLYKGDTKQATRLSKNAEYYEWGYGPLGPRFESTLAIMKGMPNRAISFALEYLSRLKERNLKYGIFSVSLKIASIYDSLNENKRAENILKKAIPFLKKHKMKKSWTIFQLLFNQNGKDYPDQSNVVYGATELFPTVKLALLLSKGEYFKALTFAKKKYLMHSFYTYLFFFPNKVIELLEKGKDTGLPRAILRLPVFNKEIPVYYIKMLGDLRVYKSQNYLRTKLRPKDTAFLIQFALRASEPDSKISLTALYENFWKNGHDPAGNLSHLLVRIRQALNIPTHLIGFSRKKDDPFLLNKGIHFTTDYGKYKEHIAQGKALLRAGEWRYAKREFLQAFELFRGEPFKKMYDDWSDDQRLEILFSYENEVLFFAKELSKRGRGREADRLLKKAEGIVPYSDEIEKELKELWEIRDTSQL